MFSVLLISLKPESEHTGLVPAMMCGLIIACDENNLC